MQTEAGLVYDLASVSKVVGVGTVCTFLWEIGQLDIDRLVIDFYLRVIIQTSLFASS
ncbi:hypothetical protein SPAR33_1559 [Streptococcus pneumoniae GA13723]|nr:hypothetical protein SPAR33_1559 [Streptococcus pneumoniae GA13723]